MSSKENSFTDKLKSSLEGILKKVEDKLNSAKSEREINQLLKLTSEARQIFRLLMDAKSIRKEPKVDKDLIYDRVIQTFVDAKISNEDLEKFQKCWEERGFDNGI